MHACFIPFFPTANAIHFSGKEDVVSSHVTMGDRGRLCSCGASGAHISAIYVMLYIFVKVLYIHAFRPANTYKTDIQPVCSGIKSLTRYATFCLLHPYKPADQRDARCSMLLGDHRNLIRATPRPKREQRTFFPPKTTRDAGKNNPHGRKKNDPRAKLSFSARGKVRKNHSASDI